LDSSSCIKVQLHIENRTPFLLLQNYNKTCLKQKYTNPSRMNWAGHVARMGKTKNAYRLLVGKPEEKISLGRPRRRWVDNIEMNLREI
jgi:hypothetical protein